MNCAELFNQVEPLVSDRLAIWLPNGKKATFGELRDMGRRTQSLVKEMGVKSGDTVLLFDYLGPALYGSILGLMGMGVSVALVEPWMPVGKINHVLPSVNPKLFLTNQIGRLWGLRSSAIRKIPRWALTSDISKYPAGDFLCEDMDGDAAAIITFTSGTTGNPKGMVRTHRYLMDQHQILSDALGANQHLGPDLCIFANFALANLASGRTSIIIPPSWNPRDLHHVDRLPADLQPVSMTSGPAFLLHCLRNAKLRSLESVHIGGALTDCWIFEEAFKKWPHTDWSHLYGSTEVEPVATVNAREAVRKSREQGYFQTLFLGEPISQIQFRQEPDTVWVSGPHVCPRYLANEEENLRNKQTDAEGKVWHRMGDRIRIDESGWWYHGREAQPVTQFLQEQAIYQTIESSTSFLTEESGKLQLYCQHARRRRAKVLAAFPEISSVIGTKIRRDRRHRARIDRQKSMRRPLWNIVAG